jgi:hypothetical protein
MPRRQPLHEINYAAIAKAPAALTGCVRQIHIEAASFVIPAQAGMTK